MEQTNFHLRVHSASAHSTYMHTVHTPLSYKCISIQPQISQYINRERERDRDRDRQRDRETETDRQTDRQERKRERQRDSDR